MTFEQTSCTATLVLYQNFNGSLRSTTTPINGTYSVDAAGVGVVDFTASSGPKFAFAVASPNSESPPIETELRLLYITPDISTNPTMVSLVLGGTCKAQ